MVQSVQEDQAAVAAHAAQFCKKFLSTRVELTDEVALVPRNGMFLEYQAMAKQDGQKNGTAGIPILTIPEFTRLIREMFPTSQLINDAQSRQVFSGIKMKTATNEQKETIKSPNKTNIKCENGTGSPTATNPIANGTTGSGANGASTTGNGTSNEHSIKANGKLPIPNGIRTGKNDSLFKTHR